MENSQIDLKQKSHFVSSSVEPWSVTGIGDETYQVLPKGSRSIPQPSDDGDMSGASDLRPHP